MTIEWNKVTWYSKLVAVVVFVGTFALAFSLGRQYESSITVKPIPIENNSENTVVEKTPDTSLSVGQVKRSGNLEIKLNSITQDSRCPADVVCIQAGKVDASVTLTSKEGKLTITMSSDGEVHNFGKYNVSIFEVYPTKYSSKSTSQSDYRITFHIETSK